MIRFDFLDDAGLGLPRRFAVHAGRAQAHLRAGLEESQVRCLLVVLVLPEEVDDWLSQTVEELIVRRCAYWHSLRRAVKSEAASSVRVSIPRTQVFSSQAIQSILERQRQGEEP